MKNPIMMIYDFPGVVRLLIEKSTLSRAMSQTFIKKEERIF